MANTVTSSIFHGWIMALLKNRALLAITILFAAATPAAAQFYDYLSRQDGIAISGGDANAANTAIQTPTPWPSYVNDTDIPGIGPQGAKIIENFYKKYDAPQQGTASTIINIGQ